MRDGRSHVKGKTESQWRPLWVGSVGLAASRDPLILSHRHFHPVRVLHRPGLNFFLFSARTTPGSVENVDFQRDGSLVDGRGTTTFPLSLADVEVPSGCCSRGWPRTRRCSRNVVRYVDGGINRFRGCRFRSCVQGAGATSGLERRHRRLSGCCSSVATLPRLVSSSSMPFASSNLSDHRFRSSVSTAG